MNSAGPPPAPQVPKKRGGLAAQQRTDEAVQLDFLAKALGYKAEEELSSLPGYPQSLTDSGRRAWGDCVALTLGKFGVALLWDLLAWAPSKRLAVLGLNGHPYFAHEGMQLFTGDQTMPLKSAMATAPEFCGQSLFAVENFVAASLQAGRSAAEAVSSSNLASSSLGSSSSAPSSGFAPRAPAASANAGRFSGVRHQWNVKVGVLAPEILQWLREDPALTPGTPEFEALNIPMKHGKSSKRTRTEQDRKRIIAGKLGDCKRSTMCGLDIHKDLPVPRICAWKAALEEANAEAISEADRVAKAAVQRCEKHGRNGQDFLDADWRTYWATCGELTFTKPDNPDGTFWEEEKHCDGAQSAIHIGLTLFGNRLLDMEDADGNTKTLFNCPGTVYYGQLTGCRHQVRHVKSPSADLLQDGSLNGWSSTVMMRSAIFPYDWAYVRNASPAPKDVFLAIADTFEKYTYAKDLRLPTFEECLAKFGEVVNFEDVTLRPGKRLRSKAPPNSEGA